MREVYYCVVLTGNVSFFLISLNLHANIKI